MIDITKDRIIITKKDRNNEVFNKSEWTEICVKSDALSDIFSIITKKAIGQIQMYQSLPIRNIIKNGRVLIVNCDDGFNIKEE